MLPILENDDKNLVLGELPDERDIFLQTDDVVQRDPDGDTAEVQGADDFGDIGSGKYLLFFERTFQVDAKTDAIVITIGFEPLARQPRLQGETKQRQ